MNLLSVSGKSIWVEWWYLLILGIEDFDIAVIFKDGSLVSPLHFIHLSLLPLDAAIGWLLHRMETVQSSRAPIVGFGM